MVEFRAVPERERRTLDRHLRYAFVPELGPDVPEPSGDWPPTLYDQRGLYDGETLVSSCKLYTLDARVRGAFHEMGGLGAVATPPEYRGQSYARECCRRALREYREADVGLVALWPVSTTLYGRMGWATTNTFARFDLAPEALPSHDAEGEYVRLDADDWRRLRRVETTFGEGTTLSLRRSEQWWRERTLADWAGGGEPYCYGYERDGELAGYVVYTVEDDDAHTLSVQDLAHVDEEAHRAMLGFLGNHGAQIERVVLRRAAETDLLHRLEEPLDVDCEVTPGPMIRLTQVGTLERFDWPAVDLECRLAVTDPLLEDTDGVYRFAVRDGRAEVERIAADSDGADADVAVDVGTLSQLAVGTHGIDAAERVAGLSVDDDGVRSALEEVFVERPVCLREFF